MILLVFIIDDAKISQKMFFVLTITFSGARFICEKSMRTCQALSASFHGQERFRWTPPAGFVSGSRNLPLRTPSCAMEKIASR